MNWVKLTERKPQPFQRVLIRYDAGPGGHHLIQYDVAWYDAGLWWTSAEHALSRQYDYVTHWTKIEQPSDVKADAVEWKRRVLAGVERVKGRNIW